MNEHSTTKKRRKKRVLDEEAYLTSLAGIIRRDYFPDLNHIHRAEAPSVSLDGFHARFTSEDNASFGHVLESQNQHARDRYARIHGGPPALTAPPDQRLLDAPPRRHPDFDVSAKSKETRPENTRFKVPLLPALSAAGNHEPDRPSVQMTPDIRPKSSHEIFTWGHIEATPQRLQSEQPAASEGDPGRFYILPAARREQAATELTSHSHSHSSTTRRSAQSSVNKARVQANIRDSPFGGALSTPRRKNSKSK